MEDYFIAKRRLFSELGPARAVINIDDSYGRRLAEELDAPITFALHREASYRAEDVRSGLDGSSFHLRTEDGELIDVRTPLRGLFNVYNVVGALAAARALGVPADVAVAALDTAGLVPGRLEPVDEGQDFAVLVDYAHTPDSLENVIKAARGLTSGRVHVVFGCGGDRDRAKRPLMGAVAVSLADRVIVTSDNPRSEDPEAIIQEILVGTGPGVEHNADRREAIAHAIGDAEAGDVVLIAGKGHEQGQEFEGGRKVPFDDVTVAREVLRSVALSR
jgi:UDP-N-acetylmuramoyl-L-alanyl-D-glutamate--2,6-diaminopimelate ligase